MSTEDRPATVKTKHPLPLVCWVWPILGIFLLLISSLCFWVYFHRADPPGPPLDVTKPPPPPPPPDDPQWNYLLLLACVGLFNGLACWWLGYCFGIKRAFTRQVWHIGIGLILTSAIFFFLTGWILASLVCVVVLAVWAQGFTRQHFDKL
jgi:hypothetical protein